MTDDRLTAEADVVTKLSPQSVPDAAAKLTAMISAKGMKLFAVIDQAAEARAVGLTLREPPWSFSAARRRVHRRWPPHLCSRLTCRSRC